MSSYYIKYIDPSGDFVIFLPCIGIQVAMAHAENRARAIEILTAHRMTNEYAENLVDLAMFEPGTKISIDFPATIKTGSGSA